MTLSPATRRIIGWILVIAALIGTAIGINTLVLHLTLDPLADVRAYYDAGARLNAGLPLYEQDATTNDPHFYRYPPLLAILFRPLALLPFEAAAAIWEAVVLAAFALTLRRIGLGRNVLLVLGMLAMPVIWTLVIGQAHALVTLLLTFGNPVAVALAGHLKLFPWLAAVYWVGRRDWRSLGTFAAAVVGLGLVQLVLAPDATIAYLGFPGLEQVGQVNNLSPYEVSPLLWLVLVVAGTVLALRLAPTRWGWTAAVILSVGVTPRLLAYQLSSLLAAFGGPREDRAPWSPGDPAADAPPRPRDPA